MNFLWLKTKNKMTNKLTQPAIFERKFNTKIVEIEQKERGNMQRTLNKKSANVISNLIK